MIILLHTIALWRSTHQNRSFFAVLQFRTVSNYLSDSFVCRILLLKAATRGQKMGLQHANSIMTF